MGQVSKEGLMTIQVEGYDVNPVAIYSKEDPPRIRRKKKGDGEKREELRIV